MSNYSRKVTATAIKTEKIEPSDSIKMESDFQSPESPPTFQEQKYEREPITIPTERRDSNQYNYDSMPSASNDSRHRRDDYRYKERKYRHRSRSNSYEKDRRSRSRSRSYDRRRYRSSRSHSRDRDWDRDRGRRRRSRSRGRGSRSPSRRLSPSHQKRSRSPGYRHRSERRDERKYHDRSREYSVEYDRNYDSKRYIKQESESDYKRESKYSTSLNIKQEKLHRRETRDEPTMSSSARNAITCSTAIQLPAFKYHEKRAQTNDKEFERNDSNWNIKIPKPHATLSRFGRGISAVEELDFKRERITDDAIDELQHKQHTWFGRTDENEKLHKELEDLNQLNDWKKKLEEQRQAQVAKSIVNALQATGDYDNDEPNQSDEIQNTSSAAQTVNQTESRVEMQIDNRADNRIDNRTVHQTSQQIVNQTVRPIENPMNKPITSVPATSVPVTVTSPESVVREERIALSDKYHRRPRIHSESNDNTPESGSPMQLIDPRNTVQPQQDPRLRNRSNLIIPTPDVSIEQFLSFGNTQSPQPPIHHPQTAGLHAPMHQNAFGQIHGQNMNRNHAPNRDIYSAPGQRPFYNDPTYNHHQQQYPNIPSSRPAPHLHPMANIGFSGAHRTPQRQNSFGPNTYREHCARKQERELAQQMNNIVPAVTSTTPASDQVQQTANGKPAGSPTQSPNQTESTVQNKNATFKKTHFDKAFRGNNWEAIPIKKSTASFKIPKLNKSSSSATNPTSETKRDSSKNRQQDSSENNVSTSTTKPTKSTKSVKNNCQPNQSKTTAAPKKRKSIENKKTDGKASDTHPPENVQAGADTTIIMETEQTEEPPAVEQPIKETPEIINWLLQDRDKFREVFEAMKKMQNGDQNDDAVTSSTQPVQSNENDQTSKKSGKTVQTKADAAVAATGKKPKPKSKRQMNELERLNADICENYPEVLSATGRRACTLNVQKSNDNSPTKTPRSATKSRLSGHKSDDDVVSEVVGEFMVKINFIIIVMIVCFYND